MADVKTEQFDSFDGTRLALHRTGEGRPVVLLHGLFSSAKMNWIKWGHNQRIADAGCEALMLDFRAHGDSAAPQDASAYPANVLVRDVAALIEHCGLEPGGYDLVGFSLGARTALHACAQGVAEPRRLVACGMGMAGLSEWERRAAHFTRVIDEFDTIRPDSPLYTARTFLKSQGVDRVAARLLLQAMEPFDLADLERIAMPVAIVNGDEDDDNGSGEELAAALPDAVSIAIPGNHLNSVTKPDLGEAIVDFLSGPTSA